MSTTDELKEYAALTVDDALFRFRLRVFALAEELGNVRLACRIMGVHPSTYYRWRAQALRFGLEILRPRERRPPRMPNLNCLRVVGARRTARHADDPRWTNDYDRSDPQTAALLTAIQQASGATSSG